MLNLILIADMDLAQQKHAIELKTKLNQALEKNKSLEAQLTEALMKEEEAENNGKLALAKLQEGHEKEVEDIQQKHKDNQETEQTKHDSIVKEIKNELELATAEQTTLKGKLQAKEAELGEVNHMLKKNEEELGEAQQKHKDSQETEQRKHDGIVKEIKNDLELATKEQTTLKGKLQDKEAELGELNTKLEKKEKEMEIEKEQQEIQLTLSKQNTGISRDIASDSSKTEAVNETQKETELRKDSEGLVDWGLFGLKFAVELTLGILEFWADKNHLQILIAAIILAAFSLTLSVVEIFRCFQRKSIIHNKKVSWVKLPWIPQFYSFIAILGELIFYICKITMRHPVHVSLYTCGFHICLLGKFLTKKFKKSAATREERAARTSGLGGGATMV